MGRLAITYGGRRFVISVFDSFELGVTRARAASAPKFRSIAVVGLGYVGLPTALALLESGTRVVGYDISESRLAAIKAHRVDLPDADQVQLTGCLETGRLSLTTEASALSGVEAVVVCVPTPVDEHLVPDLAALEAACSTAVAHCRPGQTIVLVSTTYVGCTRDLVVRPLERRGLVVGRDVFVAFSPERIDPGVRHIPRSAQRVVGGVTSLCTCRASEVLNATAAGIYPVSSPEVAELTKLLENTFRAVNIALANEFAVVAGLFDLDIIEVIRAAATKPYGFMPFYPGPGVGGHCIPCDPHYLLWQLKSRRVTPPVTDAAMAAIAARPRLVVTRAEQLLAAAGRSLSGSRILIVGVAYKPAVADSRGSPALEIIDELVRAGAQVAYTDVLVDRVCTAGGVLTTKPRPAEGDWDLVIVHTVHPSVDHSWLTQAPMVLDASYQLEHLDHRHVV